MKYLPWLLGATVLGAGVFYFTRRAKTTFVISDNRILFVNPNNSAATQQVPLSVEGFKNQIKQEAQVQTVQLDLSNASDAVAQAIIQMVKDARVPFVIVTL